MAIIGVDEVGRGAWAGPILVCAVRLSKQIDGITDSKVISKSKRELLAPQIIASNEVGYGWVSSDELDDIGLSEALRLSASKALAMLNPTPQDNIIVDGNVQFYPLLKNSKTVIKADFSVPAVSSASIVAKVVRDNRMAELALKYPNWEFENHVGYGTPRHKQLIIQNGYSPIHRRSFKIIK